MSAERVGEQLLRVNFYELRDLHLLPTEVLMLGFRPFLEGGWAHRAGFDGDHKWLYVHITSKNAFRCQPGQLMPYEGLHAFLRRYEEMEAVAWPPPHRMPPAPPHQHFWTCRHHPIALQNMTDKRFKCAVCHP